MKNILLFCMAIFLLFSCRGKKEKEVKNDLTFRKLKGKVKSVNELTYLAKDSSGQIIKGDLYQTTHYIFDEKGNYLERISKKDGYHTSFAFFQKFDVNGDLLRDSNIEEKDTSWSVYSYDSRENRIERDGYGFRDGKRELGIMEIYKVDENGNKIEEDSYWGNKDSVNYKATIKNNERGQETEKTYLDEKGKLFEKVTRTYDKNGNEIEFLITNKNDSIEHKFVHVYDSAGNKTEDYTYKKDGILAYKLIYKYDDKGNPIESMTINTDGSIGLKYSFQYQNFDKEDNWLRRISFKDGKPDDMIERTITYY